MRVKQISIAIVSAVLMLLIVGCINTGANKETESLDDLRDKVDIRGAITRTVRDAGNVSAVLVEGEIEKDTSYDKAHVTITNKTKIYKGTANNEVSASDLREGQRVEAVFIGPVAESYPVQTTAQVIWIIQ